MMGRPECAQERDTGFGATDAVTTLRCGIVLISMCALMQGQV